MTKERGHVQNAKLGNMGRIVNQPVQIVSALHQQLRRVASPLVFVCMKDAMLVTTIVNVMLPVTLSVWDKGVILRTEPVYRDANRTGMAHTAACHVLRALLSARVLLIVNKTQGSAYLAALMDTLVARVLVNVAIGVWIENAQERQLTVYLVVDMVSMVTNVL